MKKILFLGTLFLAFIFADCKNNKPSDKDTQIDPFEAATPHGQSLPSIELSDADKLKLGEAIGISAIPVSEKEVDSLFLFSNEMLHIYSFFKIDSLESYELNETLLKLQKEVSDSSLKVMLFSLDPPENLNDINSYIRQKGVTSEVFFSSDTLNTDWYSKIHTNWSGEVPAIYLVNQSDGTNLFYQKKFSFDELIALIQPFIM